MNYTDSFLINLGQFSERYFSEAVFKKLKQLLLDYLGVTLAGASFAKEKVESFLSSSIDSEGSCPLFGLNKKATIEKSLLINGLNAHTLDFDDGTNAGIIHLGSPIFTTLLPLLQHRKGITVNDFWKAVIIGYEASFTMALSIQPMHKEMGYHATGTCGTIGAAMATAYILKFNKRQIKDAFSAAALAASGSLKGLEDGSDYKPYSVGKAALNGYNSALLGFSGYRGPEDVLAGSQGFIKQMTGLDEVELKTPMYQGTTAVEKAYIKPYAACRYCHPAIGVMIDFKRKHNIPPENIISVDIYTYKWAVKKHDHTNIQGVTSAKMSIPYSVAVALIYGKAGLQEFTPEVIGNQKVQELTKKVFVYENDVLTSEFPKLQAAICRINTTDDNYCIKVDFPKGEPENPLSYDEVIDKFTMLASYAGLSNGSITDIITMCDDFENRYRDLLNIL